MIEIDGRREAVWRCRALVTFLPVTGRGGMALDHYLEILRTEEVLLCWLGEWVDALAVEAIDTGAGTVTLTSGAVVRARISRRAQLAEEAQVVREERMIAAMAGGKSYTKKNCGDKLSPPRRKACQVCGWRHDATFSRIEIPGRRVILLHGLMAQIVALVHAAQAGGSGAVSTKDERMLNICGGYRHPCKVFNDLGRRADYKLLFETKRRGFLGLKINAQRMQRDADGNTKG